MHFTFRLAAAIAAFAFVSGSAIACPEAGHPNIIAAREDAQHAIEKMFSELSNVKTDRNLLAGLFVEVAKCLNHDDGPKGGAEPQRSSTKRL